MGVRFLVGRAGSGKTTQIIDEIGACIEQDNQQKCLLIVPELCTLQAEQDIVQSLNLKGFMNIEVLSFKRLETKVIENVGNYNKTHIDDQGKCMALRRVMEDCLKELNVFMRVANKDGFINEINQLVKDCKKNDVLPEDVQNISQTISESNPMLANKLQDFSTIYAQLTSYIGEKYYDDEDAFNWLIENIEKSQNLKGAHIWIDGFDVFTQQTVRLIEKLAKIAKEVTIALPQGNETDDDSDLFEGFLQAKKSMVEALAESNIVPTEEFVIQKNILGAKAENLSYLANTFFAYPFEVYSKDCTNVELRHHNNIKEEIEACAMELVALARDEEKKVRWNDIAIIVGDMEQYKPLLCRTFERYNINYFVDTRQKVIGHPVVQLILSSFKIVIKNFQFDDVFQYLKTGLTGIAYWDIERLENQCIQYGIRASKWKRPFYKSTSDEEVLNLDVARESVVNSLERLTDARRKKLTGRTMAETIVAFLEDLNIVNRIEALVKQEHESGELQRANINAQVWNSIMKTLDQFAEIVGERIITFEETLHILETGFETLELGVIPTTLDQVTISSPERFKMRNIQYMYVLGCNDGVFPLEQTENMVLDGAERDLLSEAGLNLGGGRNEVGQRTNYLVYSLFSRPTKQLIFSRPMADNEGRALRDSYILGRIKMLFPNIVETVGVSTHNNMKYPQISGGKATFKYLTENVRNYLNGDEIDTVWQEVYGWYKKNDLWNEKVNALIHGAESKGKTVKLAESQIQQLYGSPLKTSVSRIELYSKCPFAHFITYGLRPKPCNPYEVEATDIGTLFHQAIDSFVKEVNEQKLLWEDVTEVVCKEVAERVISQHAATMRDKIFQSSESNKYIQERIIKTTAEVMGVLAKHIQQGEFNPENTEYGFGDNFSQPAIKLELEDGKTAFIEGRIDRIDTLNHNNNSYLKIIDYKSGKTTFNLADVYYGTDIQLLLYMNALVKGADQESNKVPAGVFYFNISEKIIETFDRNQEIIEKERDARNKMNGLVLEDVVMAKKMDNTLEQTGKSLSLPVSLKKDGSFDARSSVASVDDFNTTMTYVTQLANETCNDIVQGTTSIAPIKYKDGASACGYCEYRAICQLDERIMGDAYRTAEPLKGKEEIIEKMKGRYTKQSGKEGDE